MLNDGGEHGGVNVRSSGGMAGMESVKERFRDEAVGGVRLGVDSSCKQVVNRVRWVKYVGYLRPVTLPWSNRSDRPRAVEGEDGGVTLIEPGSDPRSPRKWRFSAGYAGAAGDGRFEYRWDSLRCCDSKG